MASQIDYDTFLKWAIDHFGAGNIRTHGDEICTHSIFAEDHKFHLWMNPRGGKDELAGGAYRCWYSDRRGSLISLVSYVEKISYEEAEDLITGPMSLRALERKVDELFQTGETLQGSVGTVDFIDSTKAFSLPDFSFKLDEMPRSNFYYVRASEYLRKRKIPTDGLYFCTGGKYKNRIILPYYDKSGSLVYYNARTISKNEKELRYRKPEDENIKQENYLYCFNWPSSGVKIYLTEGEFDARTLDLTGLNGVACGGKSLSDPQVELLREYVPVLAFDNDEGKKQNSGEQALIAIGNKLLDKGFPAVYYVRPPKGFKDWNEVLVAKNESILLKYIEKYQKKFDSWTESILQFSRI